MQGEGQRNIEKSWPTYNKDKVDECNFKYLEFNVRVQDFSSLSQNNNQDPICTLKQVSLTEIIPR